MKRNYRRSAVAKIQNSMLNKFWDELVRNYDNHLDSDYPLCEDELEDHWRWILNNDIKAIMDTLEQVYPEKSEQLFGV